jgi:hypothetical protein
MKKLITACLALVALAAFALPATASAVNAPTATDTTPGAPSKEHVAVGAKIVGTNVGNTLFQMTNGTTLVTCTTAKLTGTVLKNSGGTVEGTIETATFAGTGAVFHNGDNECTGSFGSAAITVSTPMCVRSDGTMADDEFRVFGDDCTGANSKVTFNIVSTTAGECKYLTTGPVTGKFTTDPAEAVLTVDNTQSGSGATKESGGFLCPTSGMLKMSFVTETEDGTAITID